MVDISKEAVAAHKERISGPLQRPQAGSLNSDTFDLIDALSAHIEQLEATIQQEREAKWRLLESPFQHRVSELEAALREAIEWNWIDHEERSDDPHCVDRIPDRVTGPILALINKEPKP